MTTITVWNGEGTVALRDWSLLAEQGNLTVLTTEARQVISVSQMKKQESGIRQAGCCVIHCQVTQGSRNHSL